MYSFEEKIINSQFISSKSQISLCYPASEPARELVCELFCDLLASWAA